MSTNAHVTLRFDDRPEVQLGHGAILGRLGTSSYVIDDPRVSEAHALLSMRRGEFVVLALRGALSVRGRPVDRAILREGMRVELADGLGFEVLSIVRPSELLAVEADGLGCHPLPSECSLHLTPQPRLVPRFEPDAALHVWENGATWRARVPGGETHDVEDGEVISVDGVEVSFRAVPCVGGTTTPSPASPYATPLKVVAWYDSVEIHRDGRPPAVLGGVGARILSELIAFGGPVAWETIAREVWTDGAAPGDLRHRWDVSLGRLRARLKEQGVRGDLIRHDGSGFVQCVLYPRDEVDDRT